MVMHPVKTWTIFLKPWSYMNKHKSFFAVQAFGDFNLKAGPQLLQKA